MIYRVEYSSMTAHYGPSFIEADSPLKARESFAELIFPGHYSLISVQQVSSEKIISALQELEQKP